MRTLANIGALAAMLLAALPPIAWSETAPHWNPDYQKASERINAGDAAGALPIAEKALAYSEKVHGRESKEVALCLTTLAEAHGGVGQYAEAERYARRAVELTRKQEEVKSLLGFNLQTLARACDWQGKYKEAEVAYAEDIALSEEKLAREPTTPRWGLLADLYLLARVRVKLEKRLEATRTLRRELQVWDGNDTVDPGRARDPIGRTTMLLAEVGRPTWTDSLSAAWIGIVERQLPGEVLYAAAARGVLATARLNTGRYADAERTLRRALTDLERAFGPSHPEVIGTLELMGSVYERSHRPEEAAAMRRRAEERRRESEAPKGR